MCTLLPYSFSSCDSCGSTRLQNGHWKSEKMTTWSGAFFEPLAGPPAALTLYTVVS